MRRINGGGGLITTFQYAIWPMFRPEIAVTSTGPAVFHADYTPVTSDKPARAGETLILHSRGLGPTRPSVNIGDAFPKEPTAVVTSPIEVIVGGKAMPAINQIGMPGSADTYRVDFQLPETATAGMVPLQLSAAWIRGTTLQIPVR